jgi:hypothetical protein
VVRIIDKAYFNIPLRTIFATLFFKPPMNYTYLNLFEDKC